jgi:myo-inositol 2-dehydrogenase/D-chiro-inositol 1-dehydrogenase
MRRFDPGCADLRAAIETGELGNALMVHCVHRNADPYPGSGSEGSITSSAVHEFDFIPWLLGSPITEVAWLQGRRSRRAAQRIDPQMLLIRTADEVLTTLEVFVSAAYGYEVNCEVVFEQGTLALTEPTEVLRRESKRASYRFPDDSLRRYQAAYRGELQAWVDSVALDGPADPRLASAMDGLNATVSADTMIQAFRNGDGRFVRVSR